MKIKLFNTIILFSLFTGSAFSQEQFNRHFLVNVGYSGNYYNVFVTDSGYTMLGIICGFYPDTTFDVVVTHTVQGNVLWNKLYNDPLWNFYIDAPQNSCKQLSDGGYIIGFSSQIRHNVYTCDSSRIYIMRFDCNFDTLWTKKLFYDSLPSNIYDVNLTKDNGFIFVGMTQRDNFWNPLDYYSNQIYSNGFLVKTDSLGNLEWFKSIGSDLNDWFRKVIQTPDGGYLCVGWTMGWQEDVPDILDRGDVWVVKTDSAGNTEWSRRYGNHNYYDGYSPGLLMSSDTSYYIATNKTHYVMNNHEMKNYNVIKLDANFNLVFDIDYGEITWGNAYYGPIIESSDGNIVIASTTRSNSSSVDRGIIHKITPDGQILWQRLYVGYDTLDTDNLLNSIKQTPDGGFIFTGAIADAQLNPNQQLWLVKTDSLGCDGTNFWDCGVTQINTHVSNPEFSVFPNPADNNITLTFDTDIIKKKDMTIKLYNTFGQLVRLYKPKQPQGNAIELNVSDLKTGLYLLKVGNFTKKIIIK